MRSQGEGEKHCRSRWKVYINVLKWNFFEMSKLAMVQETIDLLYMSGK